MEASLITMAAYAPSQSNMGWRKLEHCLNKFSRFSLVVGSCVDSLL